jgi:hypothetical protein
VLRGHFKPSSILLIKWYPFTLCMIGFLYLQPTSLKTIFIGLLILIYVFKLHSTKSEVYNTKRGWLTWQVVNGWSFGPSRRAAWQVGRPIRVPSPVGLRGFFGYPILRYLTTVFLSSLLICNITPKFNIHLKGAIK